MSNRHRRIILQNANSNTDLWETHTIYHFSQSWPFPPNCVKTDQLISSTEAAYMYNSVSGQTSSENCRGLGLWSKWCDFSVRRHTTDGQCSNAISYNDKQSEPCFGTRISGTYWGNSNNSRIRTETRWTICVRIRKMVAVTPIDCRGTICVKDDNNVHRTCMFLEVYKSDWKGETQQSTEISLVK